MTNPHFADVAACVFDAYGTLFDYTSAVERSRARIGPRADELLLLWRRKQLEYSWQRSLMGRYADFWQITADALDHALAAIGREDAALRAQLLQLYLAPTAYGDVLATLQRLKAAGLRIAILSNGSRTMLVAGAKSAGVSEHVDAILSVDAVGIYKPAPAAYQLAVDTLKLPANQLAFLSANGWDACGGAAFGFRTAWINREGSPPDHLPGEPHAILSSLAEFPGLLAR